MNTSKLTRIFEDPIPFRAKLFIGGIVLGGTVLFSYCLYHSLIGSDFRWLFLIALTLVASSFAFKVPLVDGQTQKLAISMGDAFVFSAILLFGPEVAVIVAVVEGYTANSRASIQRRYRQLFNMSQVALGSFVAGHIFYLLVGRSAPLNPSQVQDPGRLLVLVAACALVYFAFSTASVALAVALVAGQRFLDVWRGNFSWAWITYLASGSLGAIVFLCFQEVRFYFVAIALPTLFLIHYAYKMHVQRIQLLKEIVERKAAQKELAAEKERLGVTLRSIGDGVITMDTEGQVFLINRVAEDLTGWKDSEAVGRMLPEVFHIVDKESRQSCQNLGEEALQTGQILQGKNKDTVLIARGGKERFIAHSAAPIRGEDGKIAGAVLAFHDITDQLRLEEELIRADKLESLGVLAGGIAHDFNNVLSGILLKTQLAERAVMRGKDASRFFVSIEEATQRAADLNLQLLTFAKGGAPMKKTTSIAALLKESATFSLRGSKVGLNFQIPEDLWAVEVDQGQMSQVINNLVINAEQAMPDGGIIAFRAENVRCEGDPVLPELTGEAYVKISVQDEGLGIPSENLPRLFDPYFTTKPKGHGLGLASVFSILKRHDGHVSVQSRVNRGTTFTLYLPASTVPLEEISVAQDFLPSGNGRILVMDDEQFIREGAGELLGDLGYDVDCVEDGQQVLTLYQKACQEGVPYAAVIMDLTIPGAMGGREAIVKLLEIDPQATAIVSSGYSEDPVMAAFRDYGFSGVLVKPFRLQQMAQVLEEAMAGTSTAIDVPKGGASVVPISRIRDR
ncbi:MAG: ATP-binding protein [Acidobacteriota bacterium]